MPDPDKLLRTLYKAVDAIRQTPGRKGRFVALQDVDEVLVAGDLHGHLGNFQLIHQAAQLAHHPRRHLVLQEVVHSKFYYPLGGDKSHQLLDLFAALKSQYSRQVHLLMGNHEMAQWIDRMVMKDDKDLNKLFLAGLSEAYGDRSSEIYEGYRRLFGVLPMALRTPNRVFISHSLPREKALPNFELRHLETDSFPPSELTVGGSVFELLWGRDTRYSTCTGFLKKVDSDYLVSGHIFCEAGYSMPSERHLIVDCSESPAAYAHIPTTRPLTPEEFVGTVRMLTG
jgi:hypothetical protein